MYRCMYWELGTGYGELGRMGLGLDLDLDLDIGGIAVMGRGTMTRNGRTNMVTVTGVASG